MVEDDKLIQEYRRRNAGYEVTPATGSWEKLEGELLPITRKRLYPYRLLAAAVILLLLLTVPIYYLSDGKREIQPIQVEKQSVARVQEKLEIPVEKVVTKQMPTVRQSNKTRHIEGGDRLWMDLLVSPSACTVNIRKQAATIDLKPIRQYSGASKRNVFISWQPEITAGKIIRKRTDDSWSLGVFGGNTMNMSVAGSEGLGMFNFVQAETHGDVQISLGPNNVDNTNGSLEDFRNNLQSNAPSFGSQSDYQAFEEVALRNYKVPTQTRVKHKFPVSAGLSVRKGLFERFYLESGLTYTCLSSDLIAGQDSYYEQEQQLHYLGIPLKLGVTFWKWQRLSVYASAGGMMEFCVKSLLSTDYYVDNMKTHRSSTDLDMHKIQYSVSASLGAQFEMMKTLSLYAEPGVSYYFDDKSELETIRKQHPLNVLLLLGLRLSF